MRFPRHKLLYAVNCSTTLSISPASSASPSLKLHSHLMQNSLLLPIPNQNTTIDSSQLFQQSFSLLPLAYSALDTVLALCWAVQPKGNNCVYIGVGSNSVVPNCQWHMEVNLDIFLLGTYQFLCFCCWQGHFYCSAWNQAGHTRSSNNGKTNPERVKKTLRVK